MRPTAAAERPLELRESARGVYAFLVEDRGWGWSNAGFVAAGSWWTPWPM